MLNILEFSVLAVAVVIPVAANLLWHLIETDLNDTGKKTAHRAAVMLVGALTHSITRSPRRRGPAV
jgi:hypothetical protein